MTRREAAEIVRRIARNEVALFKSRHALDQMVAHRYLPQDVLKILKSHTMCGDPVYDEDHGNHEVCLDGKSYDGRETRLVLGIRRIGPNNLVTIIDIRGAGGRK